jgi:hypothetical protein
MPVIRRMSMIVRRAGWSLISGSAIGIRSTTVRVASRAVMRMAAVLNITRHNPSGAQQHSKHNREGDRESADGSAGRGGHADATVFDGQTNLLNCRLSYPFLGDSVKS